MTILLYALLSTAFWYLGSRALITRAIWSRYPTSIARFADCPACSGFWYGLGLAGTIGRQQDLTFMGLAAQEPITPFVVGVCMITIVPILAGLVQWGFWQAGEIATSNDEEP